MSVKSLRGCAPSSIARLNNDIYFIWLLHSNWRKRGDARLVAYAGRAENYTTERSWYPHVHKAVLLLGIKPGVMVL